MEVSPRCNPVNRTAMLLSACLQQYQPSPRTHASALLMIRAVMAWHAALQMQCIIVPAMLLRKKGSMVVMAADTVVCAQRLASMHEGN